MRGCIRRSRFWKLIPERLLATRGVPALSREAKVVGGKALAEDEIARLLEAA